jgi:hypothetical protein
MFSPINDTFKALSLVKPKNCQIEFLAKICIFKKRVVYVYLCICDTLIMI